MEGVVVGYVRFWGVRRGVVVGGVGRDVPSAGFRVRSGERKGLRREAEEASKRRFFVAGVCGIGAGCVGGGIVVVIGRGAVFWG